MTTIWQVKTSPKHQYVSITNGEERIEFGCGRLNELGEPKSKTDKRHYDLAFKVCAALNEYEAKYITAPGKVTL